MRIIGYKRFNPISSLMRKILKFIPIGGRIWYRDADGDGYGDPNVSIQSLVQPNGYVDNPDDLDDTNPNITDGSGGGGGGTTNNITFVDTGSPMNLMLHGISMENSQTGALDSPLHTPIMNDPFFTNMNNLGFTLYKWPGTTAGHYVNYLLDDNDINTVVDNGGFNCSLCASTTANCCVEYTVSFFPEFLDFLSNLDNAPSILLQSNPNVFNSTNFQSALDDLEGVGATLHGVLLAEEFAAPWLQCSVCANPVAVQDACTTVINAIRPANLTLKYTSDYSNLTLRDSSIDNAYNDAMLAIPNTTSTRFYSTEREFFDIIPGQTPDQYKAAIDDGIDNFLPARFAALTDHTGKNIAVTGYYSGGQLQNPDFGGEYLSLYFISRYKAKEMVLDAQNHYIECSVFTRPDYLDAKRPTMNSNGLFLMLYKELMNSNYNVFTLNTKYTSIYGVGGIDNANSGVALIINPNSVALTDTQITVGSTNKTILSTSWVKANSLESKSFSTGTGGIPAYSVTLIRF